MSTRQRPFLEALDEVSDAVESGAGLPAVARAASRALDASVIVLDPGTSVLAVACASPEDERAVMAGESGTETVELRVADAEVGRLRYRSRGEQGARGERDRARLRQQRARGGVRVARGRARRNGG